MQLSKEQVKEASLDNVSQVCQVKGETGECLGGYNIIEQTGNNFPKILDNVVVCMIYGHRS